MKFRIPLTVACCLLLSWAIACSVAKKNNQTQSTILSGSDGTKSRELGTISKPNLQQSPPLKSLAHFPIGVAIDPYLLLKDSAYRNIILYDFSSVTTENALKWAHVSPNSATSYNFSEADTIVDFALSHGIRVHGHCLIYFESTPAWVQNFQGDSAAWENLFKTHIQTLVRHFKGRIKSWDVVNEAFNDDGTPKEDAENKKYINVWLQHLGGDYIARAFVYAHQADPNAILFYNDYNQEVYPKKLEAIINMVNDFKRRGIPISGLGFQMHTSILQSEAGIKRALTEGAKTGLQIRISELDIRINPKNLANIDYTQSTTQQANLFYFIPRIYRGVVPGNQQYGITFWDVTDKDSWIRKSLGQTDFPLLFSADYQRKPAYTSFALGLRQ